MKNLLDNDKNFYPTPGSYGFSEIYSCSERLNDIIKTLNYLENRNSDHNYNTRQNLESSWKSGILKDIQLTHITVTFYKKGTCHIVFRDLELLEKFNLFGSQQKSWLPPNFGRKPFGDMNNEEKEVVKEFCGNTENYMKIFNNQELYLIDEKKLLN
ncbi:MAG: DUF4942 domain-containing protein [Bacteroidales bacterium]|jgi:hypothetical protein|nr:DUF4942 domain-containing protein [Bacteroidales bacterium]